MTRAAWPATASVVAVLIGGALFAAAYDFGPLSGQMALHIALMNVAAPIGAVLLTRQAAAAGAPDRAATLWVAAAIQMVLLWAWHAPSLQRHAMGSHAVQAVMHASLLAAAFCFWREILRAAPRWHAIAVLLLTGKFACLLAVLLIFAPRLLYDFPAHGPFAGAQGALAPLADQQLAGLLMAAACPLSFVVAGVIVAAQAIGDMGAASDPSRRRPFPAAR